VAGRYSVFAFRFPSTAVFHIRTVFCMWLICAGGNYVQKRMARLWSSAVFHRIDLKHLQESVIRFSQNFWRCFNNSIKLKLSFVESRVYTVPIQSNNRYAPQTSYSIPVLNLVEIDKGFQTRYTSHRILQKITSLPSSCMWTPFTARHTSTL
jgi:hypothetical protein